MRERNREILNTELETGGQEKVGYRVIAVPVIFIKIAQVLSIVN